MQVFELGQVVHTLYIEKVIKEIKKGCHVYMLRPRVLAPVQSVVLIEPGNAPS